MSTPAVITKSQALAIHDAAIEKFGGVVGVRDEGALDSALAQPYQTFGGSDLYEGDIAKACRLCFGVIADHPFADGNKRTGAALLGTYLRLTGYAFEPRNDEFLSSMLGVADGSVSYEQLVEWVERIVD
ncbi:type II toxin-antitoxin system death-on-curing family toxin [Trueperella pyogenes]|uniref:type II toxin-antitoxin system death-on-curing family toxin n=1 Tax=Trueperella pyogenes TaxID=1661 RepID=UPI00345CB82A